MTYDFHKEFPGSGQGKEYPWLLHQLKHVKAHSVLDYGAGKGGTSRWLYAQGYATTAYDPYWPEYSNTECLNKVYDAVFTADVLEHIAVEDIPWDTFKRLSTHQLHIIDLTPAKKRLKDGRNAHITLLPQEQWVELFSKHMGGTLLHHSTYLTPDPNFTHRERLCLHIEL